MESKPDSFGIEGLKNFMIQNDEKVIQKILSGIEKMTRSDNKITLVNIKFLMNFIFKEIFFYFVQSFANKLKLHEFINLWMIEDPIQNLDTVTCGIFHIYFYDNLFNCDKNSKIQNNKNLTIKQLTLY